MSAETNAKDLVARTTTPASAPLKKEEKFPLDVVFADELPDTYEAPDELVQGLLTVGGSSLVYGDSNSGKTFFVIHLAAAIALGIDWMGRRTEPGLVLYLAAESPDSVRSRLQAYKRHYCVRMPNFAVVKSPMNLFADDTDTDAIIKTVKMMEARRKQPVRLIVGDTLARLSAGANENMGQDMGVVVSRIDRIRIECGAHFMLIHHSGKNAAAGARGWNGVRAAVDVELEVTDHAGGRCAEVTKNRDLGSKGERIGFALDVVEAGTTKWGETATTCVVAPAAAPERRSGTRTGSSSKRSSGPKHSTIESRVMALLREHTTGMKKADVVEHVVKGGGAASSVYRVIQDLVTAEQLREADDVLSVTGTAT
ncbi:helicase RepA family protein [Cupriavidus sp. H19C3]|uniref:helicase RepA family protein n=1 Tax=Cupriavidus sp. H19C3 TaxID=3241603 RepID=UPI003BF8BE50